MMRPHPLGASPLDFAECELFMLAGLDSAVAPFAIGNVTVMRLDVMELHMLEKTQFASDLIGDVMKRPPLYCVFSSDDATEYGEAVDRRTWARTHASERLVNALRLSRPEPVFSPFDFISYRRVNATGLNVRNPRHLGRWAYGMGKVCRLHAADLPTVDGLYHALVRAEPVLCQPVIFALRLFAQSYDLTLQDPRDAFLLLLGGLEALVERKLHLLQHLPNHVPVPRPFLRTHRQKRNRVAHGAEGATKEDVLMLRELIRCLLREAIAAQLEQPSDAGVVGAALMARMHGASVFRPERLAALGRAQVPGAMAREGG